MAYTAPTTRTTGTLITASIWNTDIVDNLLALWVGTTAGDMAYFSSATARTRLAIGTARQTLSVNSGATAPEWVGPHRPVLDSGRVAYFVCSDTATDSDGYWLPFSYTLPADTLGTNTGIYLKWNAYCTAVGDGSDDQRVKVFYSTNGTSDCEVTVWDSSDSTYPIWSLDAYIFANGAANNQICFATMLSSNGAGTNFIKNYKETWTVTSSDAQPLGVRFVVHNTASMGILTYYYEISRLFTV